MKGLIKKVLYVDVPFWGLCGGDKNRSQFLYESLCNEYDTDILLVTDKVYSDSLLNQHKVNKLFFLQSQKASFYLPDSVYDFSAFQKEVFKKVLLENQYDMVFFKFNSMGILANITRNILPLTPVIIDVDMLSSRICKDAWENNKQFKNRYFLLEYLKLSLFEKRFFQNEYTFFYTNEEEIKWVQEKYAVKQPLRHRVLPNVFKEVSFQKQTPLNQRFILFYGMLNSTVNETAYKYLIHEIYPLIENTLIEQNIKIVVVGKNKNTLYASSPKYIEVIGEVDDVYSYIAASEFVFLPLKMASGTLTRILETAFLKKTVLTTAIGAEGLNLQEGIVIADEIEEIASAVALLVTNKKVCEKIGLQAYNYVLENHTQSHVAQKLYSTIDYLAPKRINVIHVPRRFTQSHWGGTENVVLSQAKGLKDFNVYSEVYTSKILNKRETEVIEGIKINRFSYFYPWLNLQKERIKQWDYVGGNIFSFSLLFALLFKRNIDLIHLHTFKRMGGIARWVCKIRNIPYVVSIHGGMYQVRKETQHSKKIVLKNTFEWGKVLGFLVGSRQVIQDAKAVICLNQEEFEKMKIKKTNESLFLLPNSVDIKRFAQNKNSNIRKKYGIALDAFVCLISGRIDSQKNQLLLLQLLNKIKNTQTTVHVLLAGNITDENYYAAIKTYIEQNSLKEYVTIITDIQPDSKDLVDVYLNSDVLILPSVHEPFGIVVLEAWASSLPVIVSQNAGICNHIEHKKEALVFAVNCMDSLCENLFLLMNNTAFKNRLIHNAKKAVLSYDTTYINARINTIYRNLISKHI